MDTVGYLAVTISQTIMVNEAIEKGVFGEKQLKNEINSLRLIAKLKLARF